MIRIGPSGNSNSFYAEGKKHTYEAPEWIFKLGLNAFEYSFGRGISMSAPTALKIGGEMQKYGIQLSVHAPYYTNFANPDSEMIQKTYGYVRDSIAALKLMGGERVVVHPGYQGAVSRPEACTLAAKNIEGLVAYLESAGVSGYILCLETLGKIQQLGTIEEILSFIKPFPDMVPCCDFGHINSYMMGGLKAKDDYRRIIDLIFRELGDRRAKTIHIHFSKIMYGKSGEIKHLTFADTKYGPEYQPLAEIIDEYKMSPTVICESDGTMAEDALAMKNCHKI